MTQRKILLVSRHDYRTGWRAGRHFLADAYRDLGCRVQFFSVGYSPLSLLSEDHRKDLYSSANRWETVDGVECFLWRSPVHPFSKGLGKFRFLTSGLFKWWIASPCAALDRACGDADVIIVESGIAAALIGRIRNKAPHARIIYFVADLLDTIGAHSFISEQLYRDREAISDIVVVARAMASHFNSYGRPVHFVPHGISKSDFADIGPSPFVKDKNVVTVGSMLFDAEYFKVAAAEFPEVQFHLIGTPQVDPAPENITQYGRMPFRDTLPFLKHADAGVAPYHDRDHADYLADSSLKLMQYEYLKLPAICPDFAVGDKLNRHGYRPGMPASMIEATQSALSTSFRPEATEVLDWKDVATKLMELGLVKNERI